MPDRLLILGGTAEARELAAAATAAFGGRVEVVTALAGRTREPAPLVGAVRRGGFGGARGLAAHLEAEGVRWLVDATHPFAATMSEHAHDAGVLAGVPRLLLRRPPHPPPPGARWLEVASMAAAAAILPRIARRAFLAVGRQGARAFEGLAGIHFVIRMIEPPDPPLAIPDHEIVFARPPFREEDEIALLRDHRVDTLVARNAGGAAALPKLRAAVALRLRLLMVAPPPPEPGPRAADVAEALAWLRAMIDGAG